MNRLHFSIPRNSRFGSENASSPATSDLQSAEHQHCQELLRAIATLEKKKQDTPVKTEAVQVINGIISSLSQDTSNKRNSVDESRVRFPKDETRGGFTSFRRNRKPSSPAPEAHFRLSCQLPESGADSSPALSLKDLSPAASLTPLSSRQMFADLVRFAGFLLLLAALIAGVIYVGMMVTGVSH
ncbi:MAG: hypothetical protein KDN20_16075 [Verrucomicrobiae bacterium]|nr:hypothetical protein [Verrucomicrobiae bacterium]